MTDNLLVADAILSAGDDVHWSDDASEGAVEQALKIWKEARKVCRDGILESK